MIKALQCNHLFSEFDHWKIVWWPRRLFGSNTLKGFDGEVLLVGRREVAMDDLSHVLSVTAEKDVVESAKGLLREVFRLVVSANQREHIVSEEYEQGATTTTYSHASYKWRNRLTPVSAQYVSMCTEIGLFRK